MDEAPPEHQIRAAEKILPYIHPQKRAVEVKVNTVNVNSDIRLVRRPKAKKKK